MNQKGVADLDPKLKETYERVMGTSFTPQQPPVQQANPQPAQIPPQPILSGTTQAQPGQFSSQPTAQTGQIFRAGDPFKEPDPPPADLAAKVTSVPNTPGQEKKKHKIHPAVYALVGIVFFAVYAVVWAKVFGLF